MEWSELDINDDILINGIGAFNFIASGNIYAGQAVCACGDRLVKVTTSSNNNCIGVASIDSVDNRRIGVHCQGSLVRCCLSSNYAVSTTVYATNYGVLTDISSNSKIIAGYIYSEPILNNNNYVGIVMLV